jgi:hypothetical protein
MFIRFKEPQLLPGTLKNLFYPPERDEYEYFEQARSLPLTEAKPLVRAAWAADAAMLAYAKYGSVPMTDEDLTRSYDRAGLDFRKIGDWSAPGPKATFAWCKDFAILAFRGTEAGDDLDVVYDANILLALEHDYGPSFQSPRPALLHLTSITHLFSPPTLVHLGFQSALGRLWEPVHTTIVNYRITNPQGKLIFSGHSLGGAMATLAYSRFLDPLASLYTFGCPRVGDEAFCRRVLSRPGQPVYRFVNVNDAVAHVPLKSLLYRHGPEQSLRFDGEGNLKDAQEEFLGDANALRAAVEGLPPSLMDQSLNCPAPPSVVDHSPARYCMRLWACALNGQEQLDAPRP